MIREPRRPAGPIPRRAGAGPPWKVTDFHLQAEESFLRHFAENLDRHVLQEKIGALLLIAPPRALGFLRKALSDATRRAVAGELAHDYVKLSLAEIERRLVG